MNASGAIFGAFSAALAVGLFPACSDWPPSGGGDDGPGTPTVQGYCSGTPQPCSSLSGTQCAAMPGCVDNGSCSGEVACAVERSAASCLSRSGCGWASSCAGTPMGCAATTEASCEVMAGCVWKAADEGSGGAGSGGSGSGGKETPAPECPSLDKACITSATCDCNMDCVVTCPRCPSTCATRCDTDEDCEDTGGNSVKTPACVKISETLSVCAKNQPL